MNKVFKYSYLALAAMLAFSSCKKDDMGPAATNLDASTIMATPGVGTVTLSWNIPDGANYQYIRVNYTHPETGKLHTRLASIHSTNIVIDDLMRRFGEIEFSLTPVTKDGAEGTTHKVSATAQPLPITTSFKDKTQITFSTAQNGTYDATSDVWVSSSEARWADGGGVAAMVDGNVATYMHGSYSAPKAMPNYFVFDLKTQVYGLDFKIDGRQGNPKDAPKQYDVYGVNTFDGAAFLANYAGVETLNNAKLLLRVMDTLPAEGDRVPGVVYRASVATGNLVASEAPFIFSQDGSLRYRYIIFKINTLRSATNFPTVGEVTIWNAKFNTYNPESGETTEIQ